LLLRCIKSAKEFQGIEISNSRFTLLYY
jgi:hypothetical protein